MTFISNKTVSPFRVNDNRIPIDVLHKRITLLEKENYKLKTRNKYLKDELAEIKDSLFFKFYPIYDLLKNTFFLPLKIVNFFVRKIRSKFHNYNIDTDINDLDISNHGFFVFIDQTKKWKTLGYEKIGAEWHINVLRKSDSKIFLFDQAVFFALQLISNSTDDKTICQELHLNFNLNYEKCLKIRERLEVMNLC